MPARRPVQTKKMCIRDSIICNGAKVGRTIQRIAEETGVAIMTAPCDTYAAGKLMSQCAPISYLSLIHILPPEERSTKGSNASLS